MTYLAHNLPLFSIGCSVLPFDLLNYYEKCSRFCFIIHTHPMCANVCTWSGRWMMFFSSLLYLIAQRMLWPIETTPRFHCAWWARIQVTLAPFIVALRNERTNKQPNWTFFQPNFDFLILLSSMPRQYTSWSCTRSNTKYTIAPNFDAVIRNSS